MCVYVVLCVCSLVRAPRLVVCACVGLFVVVVLLCDGDDDDDDRDDGEDEE